MCALFQWITIWLISRDIESVYGLTHADIGNYSQLNTKNCGITRLTDGYDDMCFEWYQNPSPPLSVSRNATDEEVPWIVIIFLKGRMGSQTFYAGRCSASLIANEWVLTARHCIHSSNTSDYEVVLGYRLYEKGYPSYASTVKEIHGHPDSDSDIGLFKINRSLELAPGVKSICLPKPNIISKEPEYAMTAGWGLVDLFKYPLQMGFRKLLPWGRKLKVKQDQYKQLAQSINKKSVLVTTAIDNHTLICKGDSGGPLWQYNKGRAILIGVTRMTFSSPGSKCEDPAFYEGVTIYERVSKYIDWIKNVTKLQ